MKFSILVPVYNVEKYVEECIQSVLSQTFLDYELILVDDGSTDRSGIICDEYARKHPQIKVYHKPNAGLIHTRRYGISKACGEWYVFLDSDDILDKHALEIIDGYTENSDCVIYGYEKFFDDKVLFSQHEKKTIKICEKRQIYRKIFVEGGYNSLWRKAVKASLVGKEDFSRYYHISLGEDLLQSIEILRNSKTVTFIADVLYKYRVNPNSITQSIQYKDCRIDFTVQFKVLDFLHKEGVFTKEDYDEYRDYCLDSELLANLFTIAKFKTTNKNKLALYKQIEKTEFYTEFLSAGYSKMYKRWKRRLIFELFQKKHYFVLLMVLNGNI